jgi:hypothetical protein
LVIGTILLLQSLNIITAQISSAIWGILVGVAAIAFLAQYQSYRDQWWWLIPGGTLLFISIANLGEAFLPSMFNPWEDLLVLGGIGLSFLIVYFNNRDQWWALIPAGVLLTLGGISTIENLMTPNFDTDSLLFIGLGLTFLVLYFLPRRAGRMRWAIFPGVALLFFGLFQAMESQQEFLKIAGPVVIVLVGLVFLVRSFRR